MVTTEKDYEKFWCVPSKIIDLEKKIISILFYFKTPIPIDILNNYSELKKSKFLVNALDGLLDLGIINFIVMNTRKLIVLNSNYYMYRSYFIS